MADFLLDTMTICYWFDETSPFHKSVRRTADAISTFGSQVCVSVVTLGEIEYGRAANPGGMGGRLDEYSRFVRELLPRMLEVSKHTAEPYGRVRAKLVDRFPPPGGWSKKKRAEQLYDPIAAREFGFDENDLWLVAQAIERNLVLVTSDKMTHIKEAVREIQPSFAFENWAVG
ncbi:MAG: PIN domain-containing protein [Planctomycetes bacterium]|nr:PIN domain-containing protein [Planctomycetota bacterium]